MDCVFINGLPISFQGWNNKYEKIDDTLYKLKEYILYPWFFGGIFIESVRLKRYTENGWRFEIFINNDWEFGGFKIDEFSDNPFGDWFLIVGGYDCKFYVTGTCKTWL